MSEKPEKPREHKRYLGAAVKSGGANGNSADARFTSPSAVEWRFCGTLGFGGKFYRNAGRHYVQCYREDETPERRRTIERVNKLIAKVGR